MDFYSSSQQRTLFWAPKVPAALSIASSLWIIYVLVRDGKLRKVYGRFWSMISLGNVCISFMGGIIMSMTAPESSYYASFGSREVCRASTSFFAATFVVTMVYNGALGAFYYISVHWKMTERQVATRIEPIFHAIASKWPIIGVTVGLALDYFNPHPLFLYCWAAPAPFGCSIDRSFPCKAGDTLRPLFVFMYGMIALNPATMVKMLSVFAVLFTVYKQQRLLRSKYSTKNASNRNNILITETRNQAAGFFMACLIPYGGVMVLLLLEFFWNGPKEGEAFKAPLSLAVVSIISHVLFPTQGIWNFLVFFRPTYNKRRRDFPDETCWQSFLAATCPASRLSRQISSTKLSSQ